MKSRTSRPKEVSSRRRTLWGTALGIDCSQQGCPRGTLLTPICPKLLSRVLTIRSWGCSPRRECLRMTFIRRKESVTLQYTWVRIALGPVGYQYLYSRLGAPILPPTASMAHRQLSSPTLWSQAQWTRFLSSPLWSSLFNRPSLLLFSSMTNKRCRRWSSPRSQNL